MRVSFVISSFVASVLVTGTAAAQCVVDKSSNEAKLLAYYAAPLVFSPSGSLTPLKAGSLRLGFDVTLIPAPRDELRHTNKCFLPKDENSQLSPVFPRPHITLGLPGGLFLEGMYLPPVTVMDATPNMGSLALGWIRSINAKVGVALRAHTTLGHVKGPITCDLSALQSSNPNGACYGDAVSEDTYKPNAVGGDVSVLVKQGEKFNWYAGGGFSSYKPRFQVGFQPRNTAYDSTRVEVDLTRVALQAGGAYKLSRKVAVAVELYSVPQDMTTLRFGGTWLVR
ncbi:MAG: hypothetical protein U0132_22335 [Gemmatimonadaceae bacterium]